MADTIAIVDTSSTTTATVADNTVLLAATDTANPSTLQSLSDVGNVDTTTLDNGAILVYKTATSMWTSTRTLDAQNMEGGEF
jgi:hypothetical protein